MQSDNIRTRADVEAADAARDVATCGVSLAPGLPTRHAAAGAHDPEPTPYFVLEALFDQFSFSPQSHLLDVGCGSGRVLAHFLAAGCPGLATGVELDPQLAAIAQSWAAPHQNLRVICGDACELDLSPFTHVYLYNPFDAHVWERFIAALEAQARGPVTLVHMSDNGDAWRYVGRPGWSQLAEGQFHQAVGHRGQPVPYYGAPQHWSSWRFEPR